jgi:hypothetical protein
MNGIMRHAECEILRTLLYAQQNLYLDYQTLLFTSLTMDYVGMYIIADMKFSRLFRYYLTVISKQFIRKFLP